MFPKEILQSLLFGTNRKKNAPNGQITWDFVAQMSHYERAKGVINIYENYEFSTISSINIERMMPESATAIFQNALQKHKFYLLTYFF